MLGAVEGKSWPFILAVTSCRITEKQATVGRAGEPTSFEVSRPRIIYIMMVSTSLQARKVIWHVSWFLVVGAAGEFISSF